MKFTTFYFSEDIDSDVKSRRFAKTIFDMIMDELQHKKNLHKQPDGTFILMGKSLGFGVPDLAFIFVPKDDMRTDQRLSDKGTSKVIGGFGTTPNLKIIIIPILREPNDDTNIDIRFKEFENYFIHEFMHYKSYKKHNGKAIARNDSHEKYYNSSEEVNSYFHEAIYKFQSILTNLFKKLDEFKKDNKINLINKTRTSIGYLLPDNDVEEFIRVMIRYCFDTHFLKNLTDDNKQKIRKKLALYYVHIKELHNKTGDNLIFDYNY